jgi:hypothetical protein
MVILVKEGAKALREGKFLHRHVLTAFACKTFSEKKNRLKVIMVAPKRDKAYLGSATFLLSTKPTEDIGVISK